jgi:hypothetical protein
VVEIVVGRGRVGLDEAGKVIEAGGETDGSSLVVGGGGMRLPFRAVRPRPRHGGELGERSQATMDDEALIGESSPVLCKHAFEVG